MFRFNAFILTVSVVFLATIHISYAQGFGASSPSPQQPQEQKPEGIAQQAPESKTKLPFLDVLSLEKNSSKRFRIFELHGYFHTRNNWFHNLDLDITPSPYPVPEGCQNADGTATSCDESINALEMRLRLEPIIHVNENIKVHAQIDLLDNYLFGSSTDNLMWHDHIAIQQAWAHITTQAGVIEFGRMPDHWGMGMVVNNGQFDPSDAYYPQTTNRSDTFDRIALRSIIPSTDLQVTLAAGMDSNWDTPFYSNNYDYQGNRSSTPDNDITGNEDRFFNHFLFTLARIDSQETFLQQVADGNLVLNYGLYFMYQTQQWEQDRSLTNDIIYNPREYQAYIPDVWFHLGYDMFSFELEAVGIFGTLNDVGLDPSPTDNEYTLRRLGAVARAGLSLVDNTLSLQLESGFASGDDIENTEDGYYNQLASPLSGSADATLTRFAFDQNYLVDLIMFSRLLGQISNTIYIKPSLTWDITEHIAFYAASIVGLAADVEATPGQDRIYGIELDGGIRYQTDSVFAKATYGILFPFDGLDRNPIDAQIPTNVHAIVAHLGVMF